VDTETFKPRDKRRRPVKVDASLREGDGTARGAQLSDLSEAGCRLEVDSGALDTEQTVTVRPNALERLKGTVRWTRGNVAGVEFADPLHPAVVDHVAGEARLTGQPPMPRRASGFTDNFGRSLPSLGPPRRKP
jgi:hypothetical protein